MIDTNNDYSSVKELEKRMNEQISIPPGFKLVMKDNGDGSYSPQLEKI